ncbi:fungal-specific transcription factor domain-containing protein [Kalaharituber pfeilii]|nr:fungal-specific transcription factor domain-containing protein [Kalaharituber pfeilii]
MPTSSTSPSISSHSPEHSQFRIEKKKRNRIPVSCGPCRNRKLKCNRQSPCENCVKRNDVDSCTYASSCRRPRKLYTSGTDEMQSRIDRLEGLVLSLMHSKQDHSISGSDSSVLDRRTPHDRSRKPFTGEDDDEDFDYDDDSMVTDPAGFTKGRHHKIKEDPDSQVEEVRHALGVMQVGRGASYFRGETHIHTILQEISEIKSFYQNAKDKIFQTTDHTADQNETFPFAAGSRMSKEELIELILPRPIVDRVIENFLQWHDPIYHIIHKPGFFKEYEDFWSNPTAADPLWLALLFIIMHTSWKMFAYSGNGPAEYQDRASTLAQHYRNASEAALVLGGFTKKKSYHYHSLRTLYLMCTSGSYGSDHTWLLMGWIIRIAMVMGLHRDGEQYKLPPFEIEIRRRLWTSLLCMDFVHSIQIGLPSMIRNTDFDTQIPLNLNDDEIIEDLTQMPTPHDYEQKTDISYLIFKTKLTLTYGQIVAHANAIGPRPGYDEIMRFDAELRATYASIPTYFQLRKPLDVPGSSGASPPPAQAVLLEFLYHKALVTLHRPYASRARASPKFNYSRKELIASCIVMMDFQFFLNSVDDPMVKQIKFIADAIASYDFAHAAISLCVDLWESVKAGELEARAQVGEVNPRKVIEVLERARAHYDGDGAGSSVDSHKTHAIICMVLDKVYQHSNMISPARVPEVKSIPTPPSKSEPFPAYTTNAVNEPDLTVTEGVTPGRLHSPTSPPHSEGGLSPFPIYGLMPGGLDWEQWDSYMQGINLDPVPNSDWWQSIPAPPLLQ